MANAEGLTLPMVVALGEAGVKTLDDLADLASDELREVYDSSGLLGAYSAVDNGYRTGTFQSREVSLKQRPHLAAGIIGFAGYFVPRLPYYAWKGLME